MRGTAAERKAPAPAQVAREISSHLRRIGDPVRARGAQQYFKHQIVALGVTTPVLRAFVRERARSLLQVWRTPQALEACDRLLREPEMEVRGAGILLLGAFRKELQPTLLKQAERWFKCHLDNWALVDGFCGSVLSPLLERHPEVERTLVSWSRAECLWLRRAALVS